MPKKRAETLQGFYFDSSGREVKVPLMTDPENAIQDYVKLCILRSDPQTTYDEETVVKIYQEFNLKRKLLAGHLMKIAEEISSEPGETSRFRAAAFRKAAGAIKLINSPILSAKQAMKIKGIGKGISQKIEEFMLAEPASGESVAPPKPSGELAKIWGADQGALDLWSSKGAQNLEDLQKLVSTGEVFLTTEQRLGVKHYADFLEGIPKREEALFVEFIEMKVLGMDPKAEVISVGASSKGEPYSSIIEVLVVTDRIKSRDDVLSLIDRMSDQTPPAATTPSNPYEAYGTYDRQKLIAESVKSDPELYAYLKKPAPHRLLKSSGKVSEGSDTEVLITKEIFDNPELMIEVGTISPGKFTGAIANPLLYSTRFRRVVIYFRPREEKEFALLYLTSPKDVIRKREEEAKAKGYILNDRGLWSKPPGSKFLVRVKT